MKPDRPGRFTRLCSPRGARIVARDLGGRLRASEAAFIVLAIGIGAAARLLRADLS